ncbi:MAG: signal peptidase I, partial [Myxococcota bacterium]|nr:signal peptidase I [Myxococcota bacterium]MEC8424938.1 signal peptidase I [Myxococcota bacterium]
GRGGGVRFVLTLLVFGAAAMSARALFGSPVRVGSAAMRPGLMRGDIVWVDRSGSPGRVPGAVIAFRQPGDGSLTVKRVVAGPGQTVELSGSRLLIDGQVQGDGERETWCDGSVAVQPGGDAPPVIVPDGTVFVLGDDRRASSDSRQWGPIPDDHVVGRVRFVLWGQDGPRRWPGCDGAMSATD